MPTRYKVVSGANISELETAVESAIDNGLAPSGGVTVDTRKLDPKFLQALAVGSNSGDQTVAKEINANMYDYPVDNPTCVAAWKLEPGIYFVKGTGVNISRNPEENHTLAFDTGDIFIKTSAAGDITLENQPNYLYTQNRNRTLAWYHGNDLKDYVLTMQEIIDNCTSISVNNPLSARQGKLLSDRIAAIEAQLS